MRTTLRRTASAAAVAVAMAAFPLAMASPAQAGTAECQTWLASQGYLVGEGVKNSCASGARDTPADVRKCLNGLQSLGVSQADATTACKLASR